MNICFYANHHYYGGLANNGGSRTILLSAEVLRALGHRVDIVACVDNFIWFAHPPVKKDVPKDTDVIIAVSISDVPLIYKKYHGRYKLAYWARPFELWQKTENKCCRILKKFTEKYNGIVICNSSWQTTWLATQGIKATLCLSGQDLDYKEYLPDHEEGYDITVGVQYSTKERKGWKEFKAIAAILGTSVEYVGYGSEKCKDELFSKYLRNPNRKELNKLYRSMDVFVCCSSLEGFFNPGVEAAMQGCVIVCNNLLQNGCTDYCNGDTSHIYNNLKEAAKFILNPDFKKVKKMQGYIFNNIGNRKQAMEWMVKCLK